MCLQIHHFEGLADARHYESVHHRCTGSGIYQLPYLISTNRRDKDAEILLKKTIDQSEGTRGDDSIIMAMVSSLCTSVEICCELAYIFEGKLRVDHL